MEPLVVGTLLIGSVGVASLAAYGLLNLILSLMTGPPLDRYGR